jgi:hypothetical protein
MTFANRSQRRRQTFVVLIAAGTIVIFALAWVSIGALRFVANPIVGSIKMQITTPQVFDQSRVLRGNPLDFLIGNSPVAKVQLTRAEIKVLLTTKHVFSDCSDVGRECAVPTWGPPTIRLDLGGIEMPVDARCAESYAAGSKARHDAHVLCVDPSDNMAYYYEWDIGTR